MFATFIAVSTGIVVSMDKIVAQGPDSLLRSWCLVVALLILIAMGFVVHQAILNHQIVKRRVLRLKSRLRALNEYVQKPAHLKMDPRVLTLQGHNGIYLIAATVTAMFGVGWVALVMLAWERLLRTIPPTACP